MSNTWDNIKTIEYYKAVQARADRAKAYLRAVNEKQGIRYTTKGDFSHLARKGVSFAKG